MIRRVIRRLRRAGLYAACAYCLASPAAWRHWGRVWGFWRLLYARDAAVGARLRTRREQGDTC